MNTNEMLTLLENHADCDGIEREGDSSLRFFLDQAQMVLLSVPGEQRVAYDSNGRLPSFDTQDGVREYTAPSDSWKIVGVLVEEPANLDYGFERVGIWPSERILISGIEHLRIPYIRSFPGTDTAPARITLTENPGDTTGLYRWWYYKKPERISSDSSPLGIEPPNDLLYLFPATLSLIQSYKDGNFLQGIEKLMMFQKKMNQELNTGEQGQNYEARDWGF